MSFFVDFAYGNLNKTGEELCGDKVEFVRNKESVIMVLSDGLGSGVKANILATLTTKIAITMLKEELPIEEVVDTITKTLPVCHIRKLAYSTFTIVKVDSNGTIYIFEFDNPSFFLLREGHIKTINYVERVLNERKIKEYIFQLDHKDTLVFVSDGVIHAGVGKTLNLGWNWSEVAKYLELIVDEKISAKKVTNLLLKEVNDLYVGSPGDDVTVVTMKQASKKQVVMFSGPPLHKEYDPLLVNDLIKSEGKKVVCGGTAANIVSREIKEEVFTSFEIHDKTIPPIAYINGIDLVTEGVLTLSGAVERLNKIYKTLEPAHLFASDGASKLARLLLEDCTHLKMLVGKAINPAHQNPDFPQELSIKLSVLEQLKDVLVKLGKVVELQYY